MPKVVKIEPMKLAGILLETTMEEVSQTNPIPALWSEIFADGRYDDLSKLKGRCKADYGVCIMHDDNRMDYIVAAALEEGASVPEKFHQCEIPGGEYLVVETSLEALREAWVKINNWLDTNGYEIAHNTSFEFYDERMKGENKTFDIYAPIIKV
ncbi:MAG: effector binding domain-containing protein [Defluviitaleaceae bacterium]|nr:effector binding domain-containing protein [Defluviitaleaceae bacterium]